MLQRLAGGRVVRQRRALGSRRAAAGTPRAASRRSRAAGNARLDAPAPAADRCASDDRGNLARLAEETYERRGDYDALCFEGALALASGELFERARAPRARRQAGRPGRRDDGELARRRRRRTTRSARAGAVVTPVDLPARAPRSCGGSSSTRSRRSCSPRRSSATRVEAAAGGVRVVCRSRRARRRRRVADRRARRRRPRRARLHRRHDRPREGRDAHAREPLGSRTRAATRPATSTASTARSRACRSRTRTACSCSTSRCTIPAGRSRCSCAGSTPSRGSRSRRSTAARSRRVVPSMLYDPAPRAARGLRPLGAALRRVGRGAARARGDRRSSRGACPGVRDPRGLRADGDVGARVDEPAGPHPVRHGRRSRCRAPRCGSTTARSACAREPRDGRATGTRPELTAETIRDGWLYTGDMGRLDDDGYLTILDRKKDLIIRGGFNVFPRDVEEALRRASGGRDGVRRRPAGRRPRRGGRRVRDAARDGRPPTSSSPSARNGSAGTSIRARSTCSTRCR